MGKIIKLDQYRRHRQQVKSLTQRHKMRQGFQFAEDTMREIMQEARRHKQLDEPAIWYAWARGSLQALRVKGWTTEDLIRLIKDVD